MSVFDIKNSSLRVGVDIPGMGIYDIKLELQPNEQGLSFAITDAGLAGAQGEPPAGYLEGSVLILPCFFAEGLGVFNVSFDLVETEAIRLVFSNAVAIDEALAPADSVVSSLQIYVEDQSIGIGTTRNAYAIPMTSNGKVILGKTPIWSTSDNSKLEVTTNGLVTGTAVGNVELLAQVEGVNGQVLTSIYKEDFVARLGNQFMLNGDPFFVAGMNSQQALAFTDPGIQDSVIDHAVDYGINVLRIWASSEVGSIADDSVETVGQPLDFSDPNIVNRPYYQYWDVITQSVAFNETESGLLFLDRLIAKAGENNIRIIFNLLDNWEWWWGGVNQYVIWNGGTSHGEFYVDEDIKQAYKNWVSYLLNRENSYTGVKYKDDPTIMTWDILNEAGCYHDASGKQVLTFQEDAENSCSYVTVEAWIDEMAAFVKSIDNQHLVSIGAQGHFTDRHDEQMGHVYSAFNEPDMARILANPNIDVAAYHMYPYEEGGTGGNGTLTPLEWGVRFIEDRLALSDELNKPVILEEFGATDFTFHEELMNGWISILYNHGRAAFTFYDLGGYWGPGTFAAGEPVFGSNGWNMFPDSPSAETLKYWINQYLQPAN